MDNENLAMLTVAVVLVAAQGAPAAAASPASCQDAAPVVLQNVGRARPAQGPRDPAVLQQAGVIRAAYAAPRTGDERPRQQPAERTPEPGGWATLVAGLLGLATIARRRMR